MVCSQHATAGPRAHRYSFMPCGLGANPAARKATVTPPRWVSGTPLQSLMVTLPPIWRCSISASALHACSCNASTLVNMTRRPDFTPMYSSASPPRITVQASARRIGLAGLRSSGDADADTSSCVSPIPAGSGHDIAAPYRLAGSVAFRDTVLDGPFAYSRSTSTVSRWANWAAPNPRTNMPRASTPCSSMRLSTG